MTRADLFTILASIYAVPHMPSSVSSVMAIVLGVAAIISARRGD